MFHCSLTCLVLFLFLIQITYGHVKNLGPLTVASEDYKENSKEAGENRGLIIGGKPARIKDFPFTVQVHNHGGFCAGVITTRWTVITAAHCFDRNRDVAKMGIYASTQYLYDENAKLYKVRYCHIHEKYNQSKEFDNDIALLMVRKRFKYTDTVRAAYISKNHRWKSENEKKFTAVGWGETFLGEGTLHKDMLKVRLRYLSDENCIKQGQTLFPGMFCLIGKENKNRNTCRGDSGGGVVWNEVVVGLTSHGDGCGKVPSVYVDIAYYRPWIIETVRKLMDQRQAKS